MGKQLAAARADPMVRGILLELDSPGGEASGIQDFARALRTTSQEKPVIAHANEMAFSAAYWIASAAEELYAPASGMVGSVVGLVAVFFAPQIMASVHAAFGS